MNHKISCLVAALLFTPTFALAAKAEGPKARVMAKYDTNKNRVIDGDEIAVVRAAFAAEPVGDLKRYDANKDDKLDDAEIAAMVPPGGKAKAGAKKAAAKPVDGAKESK
ncbi:MAG: hypothetical protein WD941_07925 [Opitutus sp.]